MEHIPREFIRLLLDKIDLVELLGARLSLKKKSASNYFACCPFHNEKTASFSVSQTKQFYYCFGCGAHGNAIDFLMQFDHLSFPETVETLARQVGMEVPKTQRAGEEIHRTEPLYVLMEEATRFYQGQLRKSERTIEYLKKRGISGHTAKQFDLGYAPHQWDALLQHLSALNDDKQKMLSAGLIVKKEEGRYYDRFRDRVMFPIHDKRGRVIAFGGRIIDQGEPKYLNSPETPLFQKGQELYGLYQALEANKKLERLLVVEGYMDVVGLFQHGIHYAVATLGTATTLAHLQRLLRHTPEIIFCFDGDAAGRRAAWRACELALPLMQDHIQIRFMFLPEGEDPDTMIAKEGKTKFEERIHQALTFSQFFFHALTEQAELSSMDGRARFAAQALSFIKKLPESLLQQMMMEELEKKARTHIDPSKIQIPLQKSSQKTLQSQTKASTPLRLALVLLVQRPELVKHIHETLPELDLPGFAFFTRLIEQCRENPQLTTGALLEFWRGQKEEKLIARLAQWEIVFPEIGIEEEFKGALRQLMKKAYDQAIKHLLNKAANEGLNNEEKAQLSLWISKKQMYMAVT